MQLLILAALGYWFYKTRTDAPPMDFTMTLPQGGPAQAQPSLENPLRKYSYDPRVDTANQPWFGGSKDFQDLDKAVSVVADSVEDLWWQLDNHNDSGQKDPYDLNMVKQMSDTQYENQPIFVPAKG